MIKKHIVIAITGHGDRFQRPEYIFKSVLKLLNNGIRFRFHKEGPKEISRLRQNLDRLMTISVKSGEQAILTGAGSTIGKLE